PLRNRCRILEHPPLAPTRRHANNPGEPPSVPAFRRSTSGANENRPVWTRHRAASPRTDVSHPQDRRDARTPPAPHSFLGDRGRPPSRVHSSGAKRHSHSKCSLPQRGSQVLSHLVSKRPPKRRRSTSRGKDSHA